LCVRGFDDEQSLLTVADGAAEDDETVIDQSIHEGRVLVPSLRLPTKLRAEEPAEGRGSRFAGRRRATIPISRPTRRSPHGHSRTDRH